VGERTFGRSFHGQVYPSSDDQQEEGESSGKVYLVSGGSNSGSDEDFQGFHFKAWSNGLCKASSDGRGGF
jgi:hypothetical protein